MAQPGIREGLKLLAKPDFAKLFAAYLITYAGNAMTPIAVAFGVLELTGSTKTSGLVIATPIIAQVAILLVGGALADRTSRQKIMVASDLLAATSQFAVAALFLTGTATVPLLMALMLVNGIAFALHTPSQTGFIPQMVEPDQLQAANSLLGAARSAAFTLGAALAGVLVALFGAGVTIAIDACSFVASALLILSLHPKPQAATEQATMLEDLRLGWREFISHQWLWAIVVQFAIMLAALEAVWGLLGPATARLLLNGPLDWGLIVSVNGIGTITGGIVALKLNVERPMLFATCLVFFFAGVPLALSVPLSVPLICVIAFFSGLCGQMFAVLWYTTLQTEVPSQLLSRVSAYDHLGSICLAPLGIVVGGLLFEEIGGRTTLLIAAATIIIPTIAVLFVPGVRNLRRRQAD